MELIEIIRWISIGLMWFATGLNIYAMIRLNRTRERYEKKENELDAELKYCNTMIAACTEFLEATHKEVEEGSDEG